MKPAESIAGEWVDDPTQERWVVTFASGFQLTTTRDVAERALAMSSDVRIRREGQA